MPRSDEKKMGEKDGERDQIDLKSLDFPEFFQRTVEPLSHWLPQVALQAQAVEVEVNADKHKDFMEHHGKKDERCPVVVTDGD